MQDFSKLNSNEFTQKDFMLYLLDKRFDKIEQKIEKIDLKFDRLQWLIVATIITVLGKDYILSLV